MFGLNLCGGDFARFVSKERANTACERMRFLVSRSVRVRQVRRVERGEIKGYAVLLSKGEHAYEITEGDVERFGL